MKKDYFVNRILAAELGILSLAALLIRTFTPAVVLPKGEIPLLVLLVMIPLVLERYFCENPEKLSVETLCLAVLSFGGIPWCAGLWDAAAAVVMALLGGGVFTGVSLLYGWLAGRKGTPAAPAVNGLMIYLACLIMMSLP